MIFYDIEGKEFRKDINYNRYQKNRKSRSELANLLYNKIEELYPNCSILEEFPCVGLKPTLFIDFLILSPGLRIAFESDGKQHSEYTPYFHGSRANYARAKLNDVRKNRWADSNNILIIRIDNKDQIEGLVDLINERDN